MSTTLTFFSHNQSENLNTHAESSDNNSSNLLDRSLVFFVNLEKVLVLSTLALAAAPTIIVTTLPAFFSVAMNVITPLLTLLPPLIITCGVLAGLILSLTIAQSITNNHTENVNDTSQEVAGDTMALY